MPRTFRISTDTRNLILLLGPALTILFTQFIWEPLYLSGIVPGIYWLFILLDKTFLCIGISFLLFMTFDILREDGMLFVSISKGFLLAIPALLLTFPFSFIQNEIYLQSIRAEGKVFHLSASPFFDINYNLSKCGPLGIWCVNIFHSGDYRSPVWAKMYYSEKSQILTVVEPEKGEIFSYKVSKFLSLEFNKELSH